MVRVARYAYAALAWAFLAGVVLQVFFIGLGLFDGADYRQLHADFGWTILHLAPLIILVAAPFARAGRRRILQAVALAITVLGRSDSGRGTGGSPGRGRLSSGRRPPRLLAGDRGGSRRNEPGPFDRHGRSAADAGRMGGWSAVVVVLLLFLSFSGSPTEA